MPLAHGFASSTAHGIPKQSRPITEIFRLVPLAIPGSSHGTSTYSDSKISVQEPTSPSWNSRFLCAMSPSDASPRTGHLSPPTPSSITAYPTRRTISPGVYICKGEGHSVRHSWIVGGRLVEFPFPELRDDHEQQHGGQQRHQQQHQYADEQRRKHHMEEGTRPPISIPGAGQRRRPSEASTSSAYSTNGRSY
ncbi:hypothetical protein PFICI_01022 [Pestalotiopsis fici W106-1]|uniref:Uncharacterized protein n=1 Tax=Pestalotiopsis fici (strain W106-1 / CGMCC3.15140) TaxID=1229662 RepID=W3XMH4_PESFW|nr:uncharacterized protein PFICI_01022 [Pestalotiopsis fici W106-1]ETS87194.1 hypothetical protein PFICI_01022 [Pestalotiopsis fici W106-1]